MAGWGQGRYQKSHHTTALTLESYWRWGRGDQKTTSALEWGQKRGTEIEENSEKESERQRVRESKRVGKEYSCCTPAAGDDVAELWAVPKTYSYHISTV